MQRQVPHNRGDVRRAGQVVDDRIEQRLHALVLERCAAEHRHDGAGCRGLPDGALDFLVAQLGTAQVLLQQLLVVLDRGLDDLVPGGLDPFLIGLGDRKLSKGLAQGLFVEDDLDPADDIDMAGEHLARAHRQLNGIGLLGEPVADHRDAAVEVRADPVHLVGKDQPGDPVAVGLAPDRLGLGLDAGHGIEQGTAPSSTRSERSTSTVKSTWPGVSMMLMR